MGISDKIEAFIMELMRDETEFAEFGRNELADIFGCVPSQINYVISTRFSPERGYSVESRRGGGGFIRIRKINLGNCGDVIAGIGEGCTFDEARTVIQYLCDAQKLKIGEAKILLNAVSDASLKACGNKNAVRADILKNVFINL